MNWTEFEEIKQRQTNIRREVESHRKPVNADCVAENSRRNIFQRLTNR